MPTDSRDATSRRETIEVLIDFFQGSLAMSKHPPKEGYDRRTLKVYVEDEDDAGGEFADEWEFDEGEAELVIEGLRALLSPRSETAPWSPPAAEAIQAVREEAIEECARWCDKVQASLKENGLDQQAFGAGDCAANIRFYMKGTTPAVTETREGK